jgi:uncharacterized protein YifN (PemK superfamily)
MPLQYHPTIGSILVCDFNKGFVAPEMVKRRPVIVISPQIAARHRLCTIIPISTEPPKLVMPYHVDLGDLSLPSPYENKTNWAKCDMIYSVSFDRLELFRIRKEMGGKREYKEFCISSEDLKRIRAGFLSSVGLFSLTRHL